MAGPKAGWNDNGYEGKALRRIFTKLIKRFEKLDSNEDADEEKLMKMAHTISMIANSKGNLAKEHNDISARIKELEAKLKTLPPGTIILGAEEDAKHLPLFTSKRQ